jgi:hypothetical protein
MAYRFNTHIARRLGKSGRHQGKAWIESTPLGAEKSH